MCPVYCPLLFVFVRCAVCVIGQLAVDSGRYETRTTTTTTTTNNNNNNNTWSTTVTLWYGLRTDFNKNQFPILKLITTIHHSFSLCLLLTLSHYYYYPVFLLPLSLSTVHMNNILIKVKVSSLQYWHSKQDTSCTVFIPRRSQVHLLRPLRYNNQELEHFVTPKPEVM